MDEHYQHSSTSDDCEASDDDSGALQLSTVNFDGNSSTWNESLWTDYEQGSTGGSSEYDSSWGIEEMCQVDDASSLQDRCEPWTGELTGPSVQICIDGSFLMIALIEIAFAKKYAD